MGRVDAIGTAVHAATSIGSIANARVHVGTPAVRAALDGLASRAGSSLHVDVFRVDDAHVVDELVELARRDVSLSVLADTDATIGKLAKQLRRAADEWQELGGDPLKQHGKTASRDGGLGALVATDIADDDAARRMEVAATFDGAPARLLHAVHAARSNDTLRAALAAAAGEGVAINDPRVGARHATDAVELLLGGDGPVRVATKAFDSEPLAQLLARRAARHPVEVVTHDIPKAQRRLLRDAGAVVHVVDESHAAEAARVLHGTILQSDGRVLLGSLYLEDRVLHGSNGRQSREAAVVLGAGAATEARRLLGDAIDALLVASRDR